MPNTTSCVVVQIIHSNRDMDLYEQTQQYIDYFYLVLLSSFGRSILFWSTLIGSVCVKYFSFDQATGRSSKQYWAVITISSCWMPELSTIQLPWRQPRDIGVIICEIFSLPPPRRERTICVHNMGMPPKKNSPRSRVQLLGDCRNSFLVFVSDSSKSGLAENLVQICFFHFLVP